MTDEHILYLFGLLILFFLSAFFSGSETALMALDRLRLKYLVEKGHPGAARLETVLEVPDRLLSTILIGNNLVNIAASVFATALLIEIFGEHGELLTILIMTPLLLILAEITPKTYAAKNPERVSFFVIRPILLFMWILTPVIWVISGVSMLLNKILRSDREASVISEDEIKSIISVGEQSGTVHKDKRKMLHGIFELAQIRVRDVMIPRTEVVGIDAELPFREILQLVQAAWHSRFPVYEENLDSIVGIIHSKDILNFVDQSAAFDIREVARPPFFVPESQLIESLLQSFREKRVHLAIVVDEHGGVEGIVTLEDVIEEVFGEIVDEYDLEEALFRKVAPGYYVVDASASLKTVNQKFSLNFSEEHATTLAGLVMQLLDDIPAEGYRCEAEGVTLVVAKMIDQRIDQVELHFTTDPDSPPPAT
ncbi:MAG: transporter [Desulfuromonas sp.]|nr:MAG: transporter [Desulfuromonas sp.]